MVKPIGRSRNGNWLPVLLFGFLFLVLGEKAAIASEEKSRKDWKSEWALESGFTLDIDSSGFRYPSAIAFVPNPGIAPDDPLYFVAELRGKIKVVTNDRKVHTFAENFFHVAQPEREPWAEQTGAVGLCLAPKYGYVFVTFSHYEKSGVLRNGVMRFDARPETFSLKPHSNVSFQEIFSSDRTQPSHIIGSCQVEDDLLYVSVGDGVLNPLKSQSMDSTLGKVLRMKLDGQPYPDNPYYENDDITKPANYVWAYGLRNPFGMAVINQRVFIAENGIHVDRFLEIEKGQNYLWDGSDWTIGMNSAAVFAPAVAPVHVAYYPKDSTLFPEEYRNRFYLALMGKKVNGGRSIVTLEYGFNDNRMLSSPKFFLKGETAVVGLAFGPDGLYFAPLYHSEQTTTVMKIRYDPSLKHPNLIGHEQSAEALIVRKQCRACHVIAGRGSDMAPSLEFADLRDRIGKRLHSEEYIKTVQSVNSMTMEPYKSYGEARKEVLAAEDSNRVRIWMKYHLMEPSFDNPRSMMPNMTLSENEAVMITDYLLGANPSTLDSFVLRIYGKLGPARYRYSAFTFVAGLIVAYLGIAFRSRWSRRSRRL